MRKWISLTALLLLALSACGKGPAPDWGFDALPYAFDALEPHIDAKTMEIHYSRHHKAYYDNLRTAIKGTPLAAKTLAEILAQAGQWPDAVRHNAGGHYNHAFFWQVMSPDGGGAPQGPLARQIEATYGGFKKFQADFKNAALSRFGSGWVWLNATSDGALFISTTANQDNPLMDTAERNGTPILALDLWEHAYYLQYQDKRAAYIDAFWEVVDWSAATARYEALR
ncbi:superoxide dismutase [Desulfatitalea alkaliphila]|uniref:Superoxide dismutase n=1 Tax=Desulfatitalea alkaliphila TaxID=2929485 RepID=A0AA41R7H8_9BACT|nr:superoxide dismutase [Desulfatitalea alkaliphila]MCJ8502953.1 superoxide dismutase [Desulfatitalea alkaliphila]